jgi:hypothetical protein
VDVSCRSIDDVDVGSEAFLAPFQGAGRFGALVPGVSLRSTPGYGLASLRDALFDAWRRFGGPAGCVGDCNRYAIGNEIWHPHGMRSNDWPASWVDHQNWLAAPWRGAVS